MHTRLALLPLLAVALLSPTRAAEPASKENPQNRVIVFGFEALRAARPREEAQALRPKPADFVRPEQPLEAWPADVSCT